MQNLQKLIIRSNNESNNSEKCSSPIEFTNKYKSYSDETRGVARVRYIVPHPPFNTFTLVAMIVPIRMCRLPHPQNCLATSLDATEHDDYKDISE